MYSDNKQFFIEVTDLQRLLLKNILQKIKKGSRCMSEFWFITHKR